MNQQRDLDLLLATRRGDHAAAAALWSRFAPRLLALARAILKDHIRADDAVQGVFVSLLSTPQATLEQTRDVAAMLARAVRNNALNAMRSDARRAARETSFSAFVRPREGLSGVHERMDRAVEALPDEQREIILLRHVAGLSFDQAAACIDENRNTLASRYRLALATIRRVLQDSAAREVFHAG